MCNYVITMQVAIESQGVRLSSFVKLCSGCLACLQVLMLRLECVIVVMLFELNSL